MIGLPILRAQCREGTDGVKSSMKMIVGIIKPSRLDAVRDALHALGVEGMTVSDVRGFGRQRGHTEIYRGAEYQISFVPKTKIEVVVPEATAERALTAIRDAAQTGKIGDGKLFMFDIDHAIRIRTGETDENAL
jgi:nitrogen regulatory protein PII